MVGFFPRTLSPCLPVAEVRIVVAKEGLFNALRFLLLKDFFFFFLKRDSSSAMTPESSRVTRPFRRLLSPSAVLSACAVSETRGAARGGP